MEVWQQRVVPSAYYLAPTPVSTRQARFLGGLFDTSPEVSSEPS